MDFLPMKRMLERVHTSRDDSDISYFLSLLYAGEMLTKTVTAGLVAALEDDPDRHRYRQLHRLVRADGIGEWTEAIDEMLTGPASTVLADAARDEQKDLTQRVKPGAWQYEAFCLLHDCFQPLGICREAVPQKVPLKSWFTLFAELRNSTRGHGAPQTALCSRICPKLDRSITLILNNFCMFRRQWVYLYRNLSGKYRVTRLSESTSEFDYLKRDPAHSYCDGTYIQYRRHSFVQLLKSDPDASDFFFPNGKFSDKTYENLSYITGNMTKGDSGKYLAPVTDLPRSETHGASKLDVQGRVWGNLPNLPEGYVRRDVLEDELTRILIDERHPVVTLVGRGGIGKTALALAVLNQIIQTNRFDVVLWFSARDIDLLPAGPKLVKPAVLDLDDVAGEYVRLLGQEALHGKTELSAKFFADQLGNPEGEKTLYVFDNFETVRNPLEVFRWLDTYIRTPNKILITTRHRNFKGDYYVEVKGMREAECERLIQTTAARLNIESLITSEYTEEIYRESDGHPYVVKILLGEVAKEGKRRKVERIVASSDQILDALFERTFNEMSPVARRVFLTLCAWRSAVPFLALEAVLLRPDNERMDVSDALEKLRRLSFVDIQAGEDGESVFVSVPVTAALFGKRKLAVSPMKSAIDKDSQFLQAFGATSEADFKKGIDPHVNRIFGYVAARAIERKEALAVYLPILNFVCHKYPKAYLTLASLQEELFGDEGISQALESVRRYLESAPKRAEEAENWQRLADLSARTGDLTGEMHALIEKARLPRADIATISDCANRINSILRRGDQSQQIEARDAIAKGMAEIFRIHIAEGTATDCSRLAWLHLYFYDEVSAKKFVTTGLEKDPNNDYCLNLAYKLGLRR